MNAWVQCLSDRLEVGVLLLGEDRGLDLVSGRAAEMLAGSEKRLRSAWEDLRGRIEQAAAGGPAIWESGSQADGQRIEVEWERGGESRRFSFEIVAVDEEECRGHLLIVSDRDQMAALDRDLRSASQMRSVSHLYRSMAHDLRAPLNAMVVNLELLKDSVEPDASGDDLEDRRRRYVRVLKSELERLNRYLQAFLSQTAPEGAGERRFELGGQIGEMAEFIQPQARKQGVEVDLELPSGGIYVQGNADQLRQALLALVVNALEAQPEGGWISVGLELSESEPARARVWVEDEGPGVAPAMRERIFDLHFTTKTDGSGIGLQVAREVARRHGGRLTLENGPDEGARFVLELPAVEPPAPPPSRR